MKGLKTYEKQSKLLQYEYVCLYFLTRKMRGFTSENFMQECKGFEQDPQLYVYYVQGWLIPQIEALREQGKLHIGKKEIEIEGKEYGYDGELDEEEKACGLGKAKDVNGQTHEGMFFNDQLHGHGKLYFEL